MELNLSTLDAATSRTALELSRRLTELGVFLPYAYERLSVGKEVQQFPVSVTHLSEEVLGVSFFSKEDAGSFVPKAHFSNDALLKDLKVDENELKKLVEVPPSLFEGLNEKDLTFHNRSLANQANNNRDKALPILTLVMKAHLKSAKADELYVVVDLLQDFLIQSLQRSDVVTVFLVNASGELISHSSVDETVLHNWTPQSHPILAKLAGGVRLKESLEITEGKERYFCSLADTHIGDLSIVSQVAESQAFYAIKQLLRYCLIVALGTLYVSFLISLFFSGRLTSNIKKLEKVATEVGKGNLDIQVDIRSNDELQSVGETFQAMTGKVKQLLVHSAERARMEQELKMASTLQGTLLNKNDISIPGLELRSFYRPASECGGDFWDFHHAGEKLTVLIGDATGHGAAAAIVTSLAKSCFCTLNLSKDADKLSSTDYLSRINETLFESANGKLGMTMCLFQIDLKNNNVEFSSAGHEFPLLLKAQAESKEQDKKPQKPEPLVVRGERLGFFTKTKFSAKSFSMAEGDTVLVFTDGLIEINGTNGKPWGERGLEKSLIACQNLGLEETRDKIAQDFTNFLGKSPITDDVTFIIFRKIAADAKRNLKSAA